MHLNANAFIVVQILPTAMMRVEEDGANGITGAMGDVIRPIERGMIKDWDAMEDLWRYVFYTNLGWEPGSEGQLLVAEPLLTPKVLLSPTLRVHFISHTVYAYSKWMSSAAELVLPFLDFYLLSCSVSLLFKVAI